MAARDVDECDRYRHHIREHGAMLSEPLLTSSGRVVGSKQVPKPAVRMLREAEKQLERWVDSLCIPPAAGARLQLAQVATVTALDSLIERRHRLV